MCATGSYCNSPRKKQEGLDDSCDGRNGEEGVGSAAIQEREAAGAEITEVVSWPTSLASWAKSAMGLE